MMFFETRKFFRMITPKQLRAQQRDDAERELIEAEKAREYWEAHVTMLRKRVRRLDAEINKAEKAGSVIEFRDKARTK